MAELDLLLSDLDGVVYRGGEPVPFAAEGLTRCAKLARIGFVTNSATRAVESISAHLGSFGLDVPADTIVTSAHAATRALSSLIEPGSTVLVVGSDSLRAEIALAGYQLTQSAFSKPAAVVQGFSEEITWADLGEAARAMLADSAVVWIATNLDVTVPSPNGVQMENGSIVAAIAAATGRTPVVAGKPETPIFRVALDRFSATRALFVGDRLDTDIIGARRAGLKSALVLTGIDDMNSLLAASADTRPDYILEDLRGLSEHYEQPRLVDDGRSCHIGDTRVDLIGGKPVVVEQGRFIEVIRASCALVWSSVTWPTPPTPNFETGLAPGWWTRGL